jgi:hypothetical protein
LLSVHLRTSLPPPNHDAVEFSNPGNGFVSIAS